MSRPFSKTILFVFLFDNFFILLVAHHLVCYWCSNKETGNCSHDNSDQHGEDEASYSITTEEEDADDHEDGTQPGVDGTGKRGVHRVVKQCQQSALRIELRIFPHTVEHTTLSLMSTPQW